MFVEPPLLNYLTLIRRLQVTNPDPWAGTEDAVPDPDPDYTMGTWSPNDTPKRYHTWDQPVAVLDLPNDPDTHDPTPLHGARSQRARPRMGDPFAPL